MIVSDGENFILFTKQAIIVLNELLHPNHLYHICFQVLKCQENLSSRLKIIIVIK